MPPRGDEARHRQLPILLSVSQAYCPFCAKLEEEILRPMLISGDYNDKVLIREFLMDSEETVRDFAGNTKPAGGFADGYRVWVTPTLLFLNPDGRELNPRILGINTPEMYGYYVDQAIEASLRRLREAGGHPPIRRRGRISAPGRTIGTMCRGERILDRPLVPG